MKKNKYKRTFKFLSFTLILLAGIGFSCSSFSSSEEEILKTDRKTTQQVKDYWYDGKAELSSYALTQARYGEVHEGTAVLVYVTEPFSKKSNTKADNHSDSNIPVLKLNKTKKFNTGIYPYSMMNSTFFPFEHGNSSIKIASSLQEWCGMTYLEMTNERKFNFNFNSYFEGYSFKNNKIDKQLLEDDLWSLIRLNPELLPEGKISLIPSMFFLRLRSKDVKAYEASITKSPQTNETINYTISYPELDRTISINYQSTFPYKILSWEEQHYSGYGKDKKQLTTKAALKKTIKTDYWNQNLNKDKHWRDKLDLQ